MKHADFPPQWHAPAGGRAALRHPEGGARRLGAASRRLFARGTLCAAVAALLVSMPAPVPAAGVPWKTRRFELAAGGKDLKEILRNLGASQNVPTWISPGVEGAVTGKFDSSPHAFLELMGASFGISWYYDGTVLYIYGANETRNATLVLARGSAAGLQATLERMGVADRRYPLRVDPEADVALVSGPPRYVDIVEQIATAIDQKARQQSQTAEVRIFPLRYAWAGDHTVQLEQKTVVIPGVATLLGSIYSPGASAKDTSRQQIEAMIAAGEQLPKPRLLAMSSDMDGPRARGETGAGYAKPGSFAAWLGGAGGAALSPVKPPVPGAGAPFAGAAPVPIAGAMGEEPAVEQAAAMGGGPGLPSILADPRTNAIIIRDLPERMDAYRELIAKLDTRPKMIEISVSIIDISEGALEQLGIDWRLRTSRLDFETGDGGLAQLANPGSLDPRGFAKPASAAANVAATPVGGVLTAVIGSSAHYLMSRISALQEENRAWVTETPKVATLDNTEAVMNNKQTMYVRVAGYQTAELFGISAGVSLRVLPTVVEGEGATRLRLGIHIDDGALTTSTVDQIPIVSNSQIDTQALIEAGQSLLIAGYSVDRSGKQEVAVPLLSDIPVIGRAFKKTADTDAKVQRLFLLTPRLVEL